MASLRKASAYSKKKARPYTRKSRSRKKAYIKTVPGLKVVKFHMGNQKDFNKGKHKYVVRMIAEERAQIRDNSLEACRTLINKTLDKELPGQYYFSIKLYPHHMLRENKTAAGAGADRLSSGMKHSFGIIIGRAAIVNSGSEIFIVTGSDRKVIRIARKAMTMVKSKLPCKSKIVAKELQGF